MLMTAHDRPRLYLLILMALGVMALPAQAAVAPEPETIATFSVVAYDPRTGEVGVAVQSRFFGVGTVVPWCRAGIGAVATQAFGQTTYGERALDMAATATLSPQQILTQLLGPDDKREQRQVGMVRVLGGSFTSARPVLKEFPESTFSDKASFKSSQSTKGAAATYTGGECLDWAGGRTGITPEGIVYAVQGNILTGANVVDAMAQAMDYPTRASALLSFDAAALQTLGLSPVKAKALANDDLAGRMLGALLAGQQAGGDSRGMQSAALKVAQAGAGYGGYTDVKYDLRVDDAADPFEELARLLNLARPIALTNEGYNKLTAGDNAGSIRIFSDLVEIQPEEPSHHYNLACALARDGQLVEAMGHLSLALEGDPKLRDLARSDPDLNNLHGRADFVVLLDITPEVMAEPLVPAAAADSAPGAPAEGAVDESEPLVVHTPGRSTDETSDSEEDAAHDAADAVNETVPPEQWPDLAPREQPAPPEEQPEPQEEEVEEELAEPTLAPGSQPIPFDEESTEGWSDDAATEKAEDDAADDKADDDDQS
jgi:uncharacterized Ntn-hydrolase superfamily protein